MSEIMFQEQSIIAARQFRDILDAMSRPGKRVTIQDVPQAEGRLSQGTLAVLFALCDYQTPVFLAPGLDDEEILKRLKFETGAPSVATPDAAMFAVVNADQALGLLPQFSIGTHEYPDRSTTVLVQLGGDAGDTVKFSGPGVGDPCDVGLSGIGHDFWKALAETNAAYPLGVDVIFIEGTTLVACPRSTQIELMEAR